jgi:hypothetical protein
MATPHSPATALVATNKEGTMFRTPYEWLVTYDLVVVVSFWCQSLKEGLYCAFCNSNSRHHPLKCPLLGELVIGSNRSCGALGVSPGGLPAAGAPGGPKPATPTHLAAAPAAASLWFSFCSFGFDGCGCWQ